jgi:DNA segregation ATPase FtsK/SpoIIIE-like protein
MIINIAQKACAAGIHLILLTDQPTYDVITELLRANIPTRLSFEVNTKVDSRTILDNLDAELLTEEDILFIRSDSSEPKYLQPIFATQFEINQACEKWQVDAKQNYVNTQSQEINELIESYMQEIPKELYNPSQPDPLYDEVISFIREAGNVSTSSVQRRFSIGYNRAARLIDRMESEGIVSSVNKIGR